MCESKYKNIRNRVGSDGSMFRRKMDTMGIGAFKLAQECSVSPSLIYILRSGGVTHPKIAARIAKVLHLTADERELLVAPKHRKGHRTETETEDEKRRWDAYPAAHSVLRNRGGNEG